jgi:antirestriction protein ArdC
MATTAPAGFADLLKQAVIEPGIISAAYSAFHSYSLGNQLLAWQQCTARGIQLGPIATFQRWKEVGRHVRKGEKALMLCRPVTVKRTTTADDGTEDAAMFTRFVYKPFWFVLAQTDGADLPPAAMPSWDRSRALDSLEVTEIPFEVLDGNVMGYARGRSIAVSPLNPMPHKTTFHELAHVLLGHTAEGDQNDGELTPRNLRECEAESVALLCCAALDLPGVEFSRGYIQSWWGAGNPIPEKSAQRILKVADQILKAGADRPSSGGEL